MIKISFSEADIEALRYWRFQHPDPRVQVRMEALYLRSQKVANSEILRLCGLSKASFHRYLKAYAMGGIEQLKHFEPRQPRSALHHHRPTIEAEFQQRPPATVAEAAARIEALTGITRKPTQVRQFLTALGMKPRKVGMIPAKADVEAQEAFKKSLEPRLAEAQAGQRAVFFMDAAHFVFAPFLGILWCFQRLFVKAPSGRQRLNVLAALNAMTQELFTVENLTYITAETVCELLRLLAGAHQGIPISVILDNARYQRCALVQAVAQELEIELLYLPTYSPNLNLIERFWRFVKKQCLYSKYYPDSTSFQQAILTCIQQAPTTHKKELKRLLTLRFQTFEEVAIIGDQSTVSKGSKKKVLLKAA